MLMEQHDVSEDQRSIHLQTFAEKDTIEQRQKLLCQEMRSQKVEEIALMQPHGLHTAATISSSLMQRHPLHTDATALHTPFVQAPSESASGIQHCRYFFCLPGSCNFFVLMHCWGIFLVHALQLWTHDVESPDSSNVQAPLATIKPTGVWRSPTNPQNSPSR